MIDLLAALIEKHWNTFGIPGSCEPEALSFTKFCQRVVGRHTKVLYFVTYAGRPLCILKTVRFPEFNSNLQREAAHQSDAPHTNVLRAPRVFWVDEGEGRAVYAEEYIDALPVSRSDYRALMPHIVEFSAALPQSTSIHASELASRLAPHLPDDPVIARHLKTLSESKVSLELGLTHGDMGRQNILGTKDRAWVIDWEQSGTIPFRFFDGLYSLTSTHKTGDETDWRLRTRATYLRLSNSDGQYADALFAIRVILAIVRKRYRAAHEHLTHMFFTWWDAGGT